MSSRSFVPSCQSSSGRVPSYLSPSATGADVSLTAMFDHPVANVSQSGDTVSRIGNRAGIVAERRQTGGRRARIADAIGLCHAHRVVLASQTHDATSTAWCYYLRPSETLVDDRDFRGVKYAKTLAIPYAVFLQGGPGYPSPRFRRSFGGRWMNRLLQDYRGGVLTG